MWSSDQQSMRQVFVGSWRKHCQQQPTSALEQQINHIIAQHPEYHDTLQSASAIDGHDGMFMHLSTHLALLEQLSTNRPAGIADIHHKLAQKSKHPHHASHLMMQCLLDNITGLRDNPLEQQHRYLAQLQALLQQA